MKMDNILQREKFPYLFVALIGIFVWALNNVIENGQTSPLIEYSISNKRNTVSITFRNLSNSAKLNNLNFTVINQMPNLNSDIDTFISGQIFPKPPAHQNIRLIPKKKNVHTKMSFKIYTFHPNTTYLVKLDYSGKCKPKLILKSALESVRLLEKNLFTNLIRFQLAFNLIIIFSSLAFIIIYSFYLKNNPQ